MKILVLGSNSFAGQDFIDLALDDPLNEVIGLSRSPEKAAAFLRYKSHPHLHRFRFFQSRLEMQDTYDLLAEEKPDWIVNFAAQSEVAQSWDHPEQWIVTNAAMLADLVNYLRAQPWLKRYLHASTPEVYGSIWGAVVENGTYNPSTPYAVSKAAADMLLDVYHKTYSFPFVRVRAANYCGARQQLWKIIPKTVMACLRGDRVNLEGGGLARRSFVHIRDVSRAELSILKNGTLGATYHIATETQVTIREVVTEIAKRFNKTLSDVSMETEGRPGSDGAYTLSSSKLRSELNWAPQENDPIGETIAWCRENFSFLDSLPRQYEHSA